MEATWNGALFSAATIRLPVSTLKSRSEFLAQRRQCSGSSPSLGLPLEPLPRHVRPMNFCAVNNTLSDETPMYLHRLFFSPIEGRPCGPRMAAL